MPEPTQCPACGERLLAYLKAASVCRACGGDAEEGGTLIWRKVAGVCTPYHAACAPPIEPKGN